LLLLDEPTVGVDVAARDAIFDSLRDLRARGCAIVFSTHHLHEAEMLCGRIGLMDRGRLTAEGTLDQLDAAGAMAPPRGRPRLEHLYLRLTGRSADIS
jgi:ABC-2 type transport system ATP-binding protein